MLLDRTKDNDVIRLWRSFLYCSKRDTMSAALGEEHSLPYSMANVQFVAAHVLLQAESTQRPYDDKTEFEGEIPGEQTN